MDTRKKDLINAYKNQPLSGGVFVIRCTENGRYLLDAQANLAGSENRFQFAQMTGGCIHPKLQADWKQFGGKAFVFETLEPITQKETQTQAEFLSDLSVLRELWAEKLDPALSYLPL